MSVSVSVKNVPEDVIARLRDRAKASHRSLQGELLTILEAASRETTLSSAERYEYNRVSANTSPAELAEMLREGRDPGARRMGSLTPRELYDLGRASGFSSPSEAVEMIREDRDSR